MNELFLLFYFPLYKKVFFFEKVYQLFSLNKSLQFYHFTTMIIKIFIILIYFKFEKFIILSKLNFYMFPCLLNVSYYIFHSYKKNNISKRNFNINKYFQVIYFEWKILIFKKSIMSKINLKKTFDIWNQLYFFLKKALLYKVAKLKLNI